MTRPGTSGKSGPTMHHVAAAAGVSQATVSLVLNDVGGARVSEETRRRVHQAAKELGYRTNAHAKVLREGVAEMIGFVGDHVATAPFAGKIIEGAQARAWEAGMLLLTVNTGGDRGLEAASLEAMLSHKVAGVVYASMYHRKVDVPDVLGELPAVVRADVFDRVILAAQIEHHDGRIVHVDHAPLAGRQLSHLRYGDPIGHPYWNLCHWIPDRVRNDGLSRLPGASRDPEF